MFRLSDSEAKKAGLKVAKSNKYGVRQDSLGKLGRTIDGIQFDSQKEANRYCELRVLEKSGEIRGLLCQVSFALRVYRDGMEYRIGAYVADFNYFDVKAKVWRVEDVKGCRTPLYRWKKKHFETEYNLPIQEV